MGVTTGATTELFTVGNHSVLKVMPMAVSDALVSGRGVATLAAVVLGGLFLLFVVSGSSSDEGSSSDNLSALMHEVAAAITWDADTDQEEESVDAETPTLAFSRALLARGRWTPAVPTLESLKEGPPPDNAWTQTALGDLDPSAEPGGPEGETPGRLLATKAFALLLDSHKDRWAWEPYETVHDADAADLDDNGEEADSTKRAAALVLASDDDLHVSLLLLAGSCRPAMPCPGERGLLVVVAGEIAETTAPSDGEPARKRRLRAGACLHFLQSAERSLRTTGAPALAVLLRVPASGA